MRLVETIPQVESDKPDNLPKMQSIEESIARYGQMTLWLNRMSRAAKNPKVKNRLKVMEQLAIEEFVQETESLVRLVQSLRQQAREEDRQLENQILELRGQRFRFLEE
jgi:hypothetical protein